jgi:hypothetical protein
MDNQYNPYLLPKINREVFTETFESAEYPGSTLTLSLRKLHGPDNAKVTARWSDAHSLYITGENPLCEGGVPLEFPGLDGEELLDLRATELEEGGILHNCASLEVMQPEENRQSLEFFVGICFRDQSMWEQINRFGVDVNAGKAHSRQVKKRKPKGRRGAPPANSSSTS